MVEIYMTLIGFISFDHEQAMRALGGVLHGIEKPLATWHSNNHAGMRYCCLYIYDVGPMEQLPITRVEHIDFNPGPIRSDLIALSISRSKNEKEKKKPIATLSYITRPETFRLDFEPSS